MKTAVLLASLLCCTSALALTGKISIAVDSQDTTAPQMISSMHVKLRLVN